MGRRGVMHYRKGGLLSAVYTTCGKRVADVLVCATVARAQDYGRWCPLCFPEIRGVG